MKVNGKDFSLLVLPTPSVDALLGHLNLHRDRVAVEINGNIIRKKNLDEIVLREDDTIEIIHFVGGGKFCQIL